MNAFENHYINTTNLIIMHANQRFITLRTFLPITKIYNYQFPFHNYYCKNKNSYTISKPSTRIKLSSFKLNNSSVKPL